MKQKIYFRADAGADIGYGHFVRTLALADMLKDNFECTFFTQSPTPYQESEVAKVCPLVGLPAAEEKFSLFLDYLQGDEIVVLDNYFYTTDYQRQIKAKGCKLICIDDVHDKHYVADLVINHALDKASLFDVEDYTKLCLGFEWALLRKPFLDVANVQSKRENSWFVSFGGSDYYNLTEKYVHILSQKGITDMEVVVGDSYKYVESLSKYPSIHIHKNVSAEGMANLMRQCENAILPTSGVCLEALSQGCKVYGGYYVDNQKEIYEYFAGERIVIPLGNLTATKDIDINEHVTVKCVNERMSFIGLKYNLMFRSLVDSIKVNNLEFIDYTRLSLDAHTEIWQIRNDWEIRKNMDSTDVIPWENHCRFLMSLINNQAKRYWAIYENGEFAGSVNVAYLSDTTVERGIFVSPLHFGKSLGSRIETATMELLRNESITTIEAKVLHTNPTSLAFHRKNHYERIGEDEKYCYLRRTI